MFQLCSSCQNKSVGEHCSVSKKMRCLMYLNGPFSWKLTCAYLKMLCTFGMPIELRTCVPVCLDVPVYFWHAHVLQNLCTCVLGCIPV